MASDNREDLGLGLKPGDPHYRAYVGPPEDYDLIAAMTFNLLTTLGLRQHHSLLDIGCGSLRTGRLLIPYLNRGKYFGIEPNEWLVQEGIRHELGEMLVQIKRPTFFFSDLPDTIAQAKMAFDFAVAQSIFSHCGLDLIKGWLCANGLDLPRLCELPPNYIAARSRRCESAIRNSGLEASAPDVGTFCRPRI